MAKRIIHAFRKLDNHWTGDIIGGACLALIGYLLIVAAGVL